MENPEHETPRLPPGPDEQFDLDSTPESLPRIVDYFSRYGDICRVYAPGRRRDTYILHNPDDIKRVLVTNHRNYVKGPGFERVKILLGNGIFVSEGEFWKRQRMMMQPFFHRRAVRRFYDLITERNKALCERWQKTAREGGTIDVTAQTSELILDIVLRSIFSDDLDRLEQRLGRNPFSIVAEETVRDLRFAYEFRKLTKLVADLIRERREGDCERFDFVSMLMSARDKATGAAMTDKELIDEIMTLIVAGHETTASALNWTWYLLSQNPDAEKRLQQDLDDLEDDVPGPEALDQLDYARQVLQESMRLYPPGWVFTRTAIERDELSGSVIPPGTDILICQYTMHRHPEHWDDPEEFRPERFAPENVKQRHKYAYLPFNAGPRHCIGENLAMFEMQIHLCILARRFRLRLSNESQPVEAVPEVNLRTKRNLVMYPEMR